MQGGPFLQQRLVADGMRWEEAAAVCDVAFAAMTVCVTACTALDVPEARSRALSGSMKQPFGNFGLLSGSKSLPND